MKVKNMKSWKQIRKELKFCYHCKEWKDRICHHPDNLCSMATFSMICTEFKEREK